MARRMGPSRFRRSGPRKRTHWMDGVYFREYATFALSLVEDTGGTDICYAHGVQLTGDEDLQSLGGESAIIKRIVGHVRPIVVDSSAGSFYLPVLGQRIIQTVQLLHIPESTQGFATPERFATPPMTSEGLGGEDILWTRTVFQPASNTGTEPHSNTQYSFWTDGVTNVFYHDWWPSSDREFDVDINVSRRLEEDKQLWMVTYVDSSFGATPLLGHTGTPSICYGGYLRELAIKGE